MSVRRMSEDELRSLFPSGRLDDLHRLLLRDDDEIEELGPAADPEEFGLAYLGSGASSVVMTHPHDDASVIRVCQEEDGWIAYACEGEENPLRPRVSALCWSGGVWVAVAERLHDAAPDDAIGLLADIDAATSRSPKRLPSDEAARLVRDAERRGLILDDVERRNVMMRADGRAVLNDPSSFMSWHKIMDLKREFSIGREDEPEPGW